LTERERYAAVAAGGAAAVWRAAILIGGVIGFFRFGPEAAIVAAIFYPLARAPRR
jgi:uncharacterized membrane protein (UPF0136 family)